MGYIGQEPSVGGYELLTISGTINGSNTSFTLSKAPASANHLMLIINGVLQIWGTGYTVSGTTLTTTSAPATGSVMACLMLGSVYDVGKPTDGSVVAASIGNDQIDSQHYVDGSIDLAHMSSESVDEDNLHISNAGSNGQFLSKQSGNAGGLTWAAVSSDLTPYFFAYQSDASITVSDNTSTQVTLNAERHDSDSAFDITGGNHKFVVPVAGVYYVEGQIEMGSSSSAQEWIAIYKDGAAWTHAYQNRPDGGTRCLIQTSGLMTCVVGTVIRLYGQFDSASGTPAFYGGSMHDTYLLGFRIG